MSATWRKDGETLYDGQSFLKRPADLTFWAGAWAHLECAVEGHPTNFPASHECCIHVMPDDDIFFVAHVTVEDVGVYSYTTRNAAGRLSPKATLTVLAVVPDAGRDDSWTAVGMMIDVVACCTVGTSLLWAVVIYRMHRKSKDYSIASTASCPLKVRWPKHRRATAARMLEATGGSWPHRPTVMSPKAQTINQAVFGGREDSAPVPHLAVPSQQPVTVHEEEEGAKQGEGAGPLGPPHTTTQQCLLQD
ncbi:hypothetical protein MATL_G00104930 [Megalops atlanticus]|uniref:Uncharacterized protein n=1 Tax=Megalops atlanticus TaxID=7932 RepID=A0A9D3Q3C5_MEGAT|nr:hypothetical protein MATL_G00104930 [Megalops atlanticus]